VHVERLTADLPIRIDRHVHAMHKEFILSVTLLAPVIIFGGIFGAGAAWLVETKERAELGPMVLSGALFGVCVLLLLTTIRRVSRAGRNWFEGLLLLGVHYILVGLLVVGVFGLIVFVGGLLRGRFRQPGLLVISAGSLVSYLVLRTWFFRQLRAAATRQILRGEDLAVLHVEEED